MAIFSLKFTATSFTEGQSGAGFYIAWDGAVTTATTLRWEVIFSGRLPASASDFVNGVTSGTFTVPVSAKAGQSAIIPLNILNDKIAEPVQDLTVRLSLDSTNPDGHTLAATDYATTITDDDTAATEPLFSLGGNGNANLFTLGESVVGRIEGAGGNDQYIVTRYQTANVVITDDSGNDVIRFDSGVSIASVTPGFGNLNVEITLGTGAVITVNRPTRSEWKYQLGDGAVMTWTEFVAATSSSLTVSTYLDSTTLGAGGSTVATSYSGSSGRDDVFTAGEDSPSTLEGLGGNDIYIITRFQNANVRLEDVFGDNVVKFDVGVEIATAVPVGRGPAGAIITLVNGARVTVNRPRDWDFQIADGEAMSWAAFQAKIGSSGYVVNIPPTAADNVITINSSSSYSFKADDFGFTDADNDALAHIEIVTLPNGGALQLRNDADSDTEATYSAVTAGQMIAAADIWKLLFTAPATALAGTKDYASFTFKVNDGKADSATANSIAFDINTAPVLANALPDYTQNIVAGGKHTYQFAENSFSDADGDILTYAAVQLDSAGNALALPTGLRFDAATRTFTFDDTVALSTYVIKVTASDGLGLSVSDEFDLQVAGLDPAAISDKSGTELDDGGMPTNPDII